MREIQLAGGFVCFKHRKINDPAKCELVGVDQLQLFANSVARTARKLGKGFWHTGAEKHRITVFQAQLGFDLLGALRPDIFGKWSCTFAFAEENISQPGLEAVKIGV